MKVEFDRGANAAYIYLKHPIDRAGVASTHACDPLPRQVRGALNLDFDATGRLIGIEVLNATRVLPQELLERAARV